MGYYIRATDGELRIPRANHAAAAIALADALEMPRDYRKQGGFTPTLSEEASDPATEVLWDLLEYVGFNPDESVQEPGTLTLSNYDGKTSSELDLASAALAPFIVDGDYLIWSGEEGETWRWFYKDGEFYEQWPEIIWPEVSVKAGA